MSNRCIINVATPEYAAGQRRLSESLKPYAVHTLLWSDGGLPPGSPPHKGPGAVPYAFKLYAFAEARRQGYESILWLDASMYAIRDPAPVFEVMESQGYMIEACGGWLGNWTTDAFLTHHKISRDDAMTIPMFSAGFCGFDFRHSLAREFVDAWMRLSKDGVSFHGPWYGASHDPRFKGHRHDMAAGSLLAHRMGMKMTDPRFMVYGAYLEGREPGPDVCFICRGIS